eukprot:COSAG06_NODE_1770_length_8429_cov_5.051981_7_plen_45_part_00
MMGQILPFGVPTPRDGSVAAVTRSAVISDFEANWTIWDGVGEAA